MAARATDAAHRVKLVECPRDAWQGLPHRIPTAEKVRYLRKLVACGFRHIDAVSFVSPKYVPQMADSERVMEELSAGEPALQDVEIIGIVVNEAGLERALRAPGVTTIGYPHSLSEQFLASNAHTGVEQSRALAGRLASACALAQRQLVVYISMAFGNPYGEPWSAEEVAAEVSHLRKSGVRAVSLADTVGLARPEEVARLLGAVLGPAGGVEIGVHLHSRPDQAVEKVLAAYDAGCRRFDSALTGLGGCPFAGDRMVGNIPTEIVVTTLKRRGAWAPVTPTALVRALDAARQLRGRYAGL